MTFGLPLATPAQEELIINGNTATGGGGGKAVYSYVGKAQAKFTGYERTKVVNGADGNPVSFTLVASWLGTSPEVSGVKFKTFYDFPDYSWAAIRDAKTLGVAADEQGNYRFSECVGKYATITIAMGKPNANGKTFQKIVKVEPAESTGPTGPTIL